MFGRLPKSFVEKFIADYEGSDDGYRYEAYETGAQVKVISIDILNQFYICNLMNLF